MNTAELTVSRQDPNRLGGGVMFDGIAARYDLLNRLISLGLDQSWRRQLVQAMACSPADHVLDVATGTADVALALAQEHPGVRITGIDPSEAMMAVGREKAVRAGLGGRVALQTGDAQALPFADNAFAHSCISFGIRNVPDRVRGLQEMARVTRPGGRVVVLELAQPEQGMLAPFARAYVRWVVPLVGGLLSGRAAYRYLQSSVEAFPRPMEFATLMRKAGLQRVEIKRLSFGAAHLFVGWVPAADGAALRH